MSEALKFGTSGLRGLVTDLVGWPSYAYALAFLRAQLAAGAIQPGDRVLVGRDLRASSAGIAEAVFSAARTAGLVPVDAGALPTPALALAAWGKSPAIMVTGSHIPDDRNGLKFYGVAGEITKADETAILAQFAALDPAADPLPAPEAADALSTAGADYIARYVDFFGPIALAGLSVGVYQHSSVARDLLVELLTGLGATAVPLGRAEAFIPVDTEALRPEDVALAAGWAAEQTLDAIVSTDGDADRPLVADAAGVFLRGDIVGLLTARHLGLDTIVTPVTSNSAIERSGVDRVLRTRVGSPFVIAGMDQARSDGALGIVGFEANGGVLLGSDVTRDDRHLAALPTRDAALPIISVLAEAVRQAIPVATLAAGLNANHAAAHRLQHVSSEASQALLTRLANEPDFTDLLFAPRGAVDHVDSLDGVRVTLASGAIVHFRASGNAPELRCYVEGRSASEAEDLLAWGLNAAAEALDYSPARVSASSPNRA